MHEARAEFLESFPPRRHIVLGEISSFIRKRCASSERNVMGCGAAPRNWVSLRAKPPTSDLLETHFHGRNIRFRVVSLAR
ncbi:Hypothetical protein NTJ_16140 [Nesidiocoris tenuis]|uniref:Uncharacterized protein n=1 Tax=Nesidiocoris tenuis TaxID=355587 RepID=A0ABN7BIE1_9HEMI|nr:Hypothetical protein NTJ_16140 [Nesidiocoris tenuis]